MVRDLRQWTTALAAALVFALLSVLSAQQMAPDRADMDRMSIVHATGLDAADLCGDVPGHHAHHCPLCNGLPGAPDLACPDRTQRLAFVIHRATGRDLVLGPQHFFNHVSVRGPPRLT